MMPNSRWSRGDNRSSTLVRLGPALAGAASTLALVVFPTLGLIMIAAAVVAAVARRSRPGSWFVYMAGSGLPLLLVAYIQRKGPGTVCWQTATSAGCDEYLNPWPWLAAGLILVLVGAAGWLVTKRVGHASA